MGYLIPQKGFGCMCVGMCGGGGVQMWELEGGEGGGGPLFLAFFSNILHIFCYEGIQRMSRSTPIS